MRIMPTLKQELLLASAERRLVFLPRDMRQETLALLSLGYLELADIACAVNWSKDPPDVALLLSYFLAIRKGYPCLPLKKECFAICTSELEPNTAWQACEAIRCLPDKTSQLWTDASTLYSPFKLIGSATSSFLFSTLRAEQWWRLSAACAGGRNLIPLLKEKWTDGQSALGNRSTPGTAEQNLLEVDAAAPEASGVEDLNYVDWLGMRRISAAVLRRALPGSLQWIDTLLLQNAQAIDLATMDALLQIVPPTANIVLLADGSSSWPPWTLLASLFQDAPRGSLESYVPDLPRPPAIELD